MAVGCGSRAVPRLDPRAAGSRLLPCGGGWGGEFVFYVLLQGGFVAARYGMAVYEDGGSLDDADGISFLVAGVHSGFGFGRGHASFEGVGVEAGLGGVGGQFLPDIFS